jgi:hypothetical protein
MGDRGYDGAEPSQPASLRALERNGSDASTIMLRGRPLPQKVSLKRLMHDNFLFFEIYLESTLTVESI